MNEELKSSVSSANTIVSGIAERDGLAVVLVDDDKISAVAASNDNSICKILSGSREFAPKCRQYCGQVFNKALKSSKPLKYTCHAGLDCIAVPVKIEGRKPLVAITGRTFTKADEYRKATHRAISGDWRHFPPTKFFENVLFSSSDRALEKAARRLADLDMDVKLSMLPPAVNDVGPKAAGKVDPSLLKGADDVGAGKDDVGLTSKQGATGLARDLSEWRSKFHSMLDRNYTDACRSVVNFVGERFGLSSVAWLEVRKNSFEKMHAIGEMKNQKIQISVAADDKALLGIFEKEGSIELRERGEKPGGSPAPLRLFPISVSGVIRSGLVIGERADEARLAGRVARFCHSIAPELEILSLREELSRRSWLDSAMEKFNESLMMPDKVDFWQRLMQTTAELLQAERGSLMIFDDQKEKLVIKAAIGRKADLISQSQEQIGERISLKVWHTGRPVAVQDITKLALSEAPADWKYVSKSFISYPLLAGDRKVGVLNLTDKAGGGKYDDFDLQLLDSIVPQIAVAVDRAILKSKAGEFEKLSVTDALTGLLNRRYLEQRLAEEIKRSNRHGYPMCFMMIDVDDFKSYNDTFLHPEGDKALRIVGNCLKDTLRGADVAVRYGGEEFSILLPQTNIDEAETIAERVRRRVASTRFPHRQVTVSIGIAAISPVVNSVARLIESADTALFEAKKQGKNNVQVFDAAGEEMRFHA